MKRLENKTVFVTAAAQGIGWAIAHAMHHAGATVFATDLQPIAGLPCQCLPLDVLDKAAIFATIQALPRLDVLVNCAGYVHSGTILECDDTDWQRSFDLNTKSAFWTMQAALPTMLAQQQGSIINISSVASSIKGAPNRFVYGATKAALIGMTKAAAIDFVQHGIRINAICPGTVDTPSWQARVESQAVQSATSTDTVRQSFVARQPMGRVGQPQEIAALAVYLASDESAFTTGQTHIIDGGWSL
jgi:2-keto-3-deoxy-L-fuconate dehydrogenase